ncbi:MAG: FtsQ-type POTRA domain-containing protein [Methylococcales bacterium]|nr:FtsQ-type POTRA domain-containing protein [Methylococcales bacterium]
MKRTWISYTIILSFLVLLALLGWRELKKKSSEWLPIKYVKIEGTFQYIDKTKIQQLLANKISHGLYNVNLQKAQETILSLAWVKHAIIKRVWSDTINIKIIEQIPVVKWGNIELMNAQGELFKPDNIHQFDSLPTIYATEGNEKHLLGTMNDLALVLSKHSLNLTEFQVSDRGAWSVTLDSELIFKLGRNQPFDKLRLFLKTMTLIGQEQIEKIAIVDLRYPNGYSLKWKTMDTQIDWVQIANKNK